MAKLRELTKVLRSKNAGPFMLTFDLMFKKREDFEHVVTSNVLTAERAAEILRCRADQVSVLVYAPANAIKITIPREHPSGAFDDSDVFGCQQHAGLLDLEVLAAA
jgi:hypothetical protein